MIQERTIYVGERPYLLVCEPSLRKAPNGDLIIVFQSGGPKEPANDNELFLTRSRDNGETWSEPELIFSTPDKGTWCPEVYVADGTITAIVCEVEQKHHFGTLKVFRSHSSDNGYSWSPREKFGEFHECCNIRQRVIRSDGAWVLPFCYTVATEPEHGSMPEHIRENPRKTVWINFYQRHLYRSGVLISTDQGLTFTRHEVPADHEHRFLWEPSVVELSDGRLVMFMRHEYNGWLWRSESADGGVTWSKAEQSDIPDPAVKTRLFKLSDGRILLFCHPNSQQRCPLELWVSSDDMKSWSKKINLQHLSPVREGREFNSYHYPDGYVDETEGRIRVAVDLNRRELVMLEISLDELD